MQQKKFESQDFTDKALVDASTETVGMQPSQKSLWAQAELTRRLMQSIKDFDKSTSEYSKKLLNLSLVLLLIALAQLMVSVFMLPIPIWLQVIVWIVLVGYIVKESRELTRK
jgi:hypothetical protein